MNAIPPNIVKAMLDAKRRRPPAGEAELSGRSGPNPDAYCGRTPPISPDIRIDPGSVGRPGGPVLID